MFGCKDLIHNQTLKLLFKCYRSEWNQWRESNGFFKHIDWIDVWIQGVTPTQYYALTSSSTSKPSQFSSSLSSESSASVSTECSPSNSCHPSFHNAENEDYQRFQSTSLRHQQRRPSDSVFFCGTEESVNKYDQEWYIKFSAVLLTSSILILPLAIIAALYFRHIGGLIASTAVWGTSINHWRKPRRCWRRTLDVFVVRSAISYHAMLAFEPDIFVPSGLLWIILVEVVGILYISARGLSRKGLHFESSLLHLAMHVCGILGNLIIYRAVYSTRSNVSG